MNLDCVQMHVVPVCFTMERPSETTLEDLHQQDAVPLPTVPEVVHTRVGT